MRWRLRWRVYYGGAPSREWSTGRPPARPGALSGGGGGPHESRISVPRDERYLWGRRRQNQLVRLSGGSTRCETDARERGCRGSRPPLSASVMHGPSFSTPSGVELRFVTRPDAPDRSLCQWSRIKWPPHLNSNQLGPRARPPVRNQFFRTKLPPQSGAYAFTRCWGIRREFVPDKIQAWMTWIMETENLSNVSNCQQSMNQKNTCHTCAHNFNKFVNFLNFYKLLI